MVHRRQQTRIAGRGLLCLALCLLSQAQAASLTVRVLDRDGEPVPDVAVYADVSDAESTTAVGQHTVMDQVNKRFVPHILVIQKGTNVDFPNSDSTAHHVYSFSKPNEFMLPLYKGDAHPPVEFDHIGLVTLGCNIHDQMLGYILVVGSGIFGKTDTTGAVRLETGDLASLSISIWSPRIKPKDETLTQAVAPGSTPELVFRLQGRLRPPHDNDTGGVQWTDY